MENSKIEWCTHSFNPWWGCIKVSPGCKHCYAETLDNRYNHENPHWGPGSGRKPMSEAYWQQLFTWNNKAKAKGQPDTVFCASMADVFEGHVETIPHLKRLFDVIPQTPWLIYLLLTKRPDNVLKLVPESWIKNGFPPNVWTGASIEDQDYPMKRLPYLLNLPTPRIFLSCEPLLGPLDLTKIVIPPTGMPYHYVNALSGITKSRQFNDEGSSNGMPLMETEDFNKIKWVIAGGESGHGARPVHPDWLRSLRDQCEAADVPFFFKQWGEYVSWIDTETEPEKAMAWKNNEFELMDYEMCLGRVTMVKVGKKAAGSLLDGKEYKQLPNFSKPLFI